MATEPIETLEQFIEERYQLVQMKMPQANSPRKESFKPTKKKKEAKQKWQVVTADDDGTEEVVEVETGLLRSITDRLAKLNVLEIMMKDMNQLKASLEYSWWQINQLLSDNRNLKQSVQDMESRMNVLVRENKRLSETLLDQQCRSMRNNLVLSGIAEEDSVDCETGMKTFMTEQLKLPSELVKKMSPSPEFTQWVK